MVRVTVQSLQVRRIEDGFFIVRKMPRRQYSPRVLCDVTEIARGGEMAESRDGAPRRAGPYRSNGVGHRWYSPSFPGRSEVIRPLYVITRVDLARVIPT